jgi:hypothetical protein
MNFDSQPRILAFPTQTMQAVLADESLHAPLPEAPLRPGSRMVPCICGGRDQTDGPLVLRALLYPGTAAVQPLSDGRFAFRGYWSLAVLNALAEEMYEGEELSDEQYAALLPAGSPEN